MHGANGNVSYFSSCVAAFVRIGAANKRNQHKTATNWLAIDTMQEVNCPRRSAQMCRRAATRTKENKYCAPDTESAWYNQHLFFTNFPRISRRSFVARRGWAAALKLLPLLNLQPAPECISSGLFPLSPILFPFCSAVFFRFVLLASQAITNAHKTHGHRTNRARQRRTEKDCTREKLKIHKVRWSIGRRKITFGPSLPLSLSLSLTFPVHPLNTHK